MSSQLLRFITAGSVDDGKSTLIGRLLHDSKAIFSDQLDAISQNSAKRGLQQIDLSLLTDGLQAEREQGITIDVAYRYFATPKRKFIIGDAPGHEQYTRNMVTAASTANLVIILVDARKGIMAQTRRHSYLAALLGVPHFVLAVNKMDMVDYQQARFDEICAEYQSLAQQLGIQDLHCIPMSALQGDMVVECGDNMPWYQGEPLLSVLENITIQHDINTADFRFPVQWVCRPQQAEYHDFRGFMGRIESGGISVGDEITVLPNGQHSTLRQILSYDGEHSQASAPQSITLLLADEIDISRGDMLVKREQLPRVSKTLSATLCWLNEAPLDSKRSYWLKHSTRMVKCKLAQLQHRTNIHTLQNEPCATLNINDIAQVELKLQQPVCVDDYHHNRATGSFILIDEATNHTVAAGMVY